MVFRVNLVQFIFVAVLLLAVNHVRAEDFAGRPDELYYFWGEGCGLCEQADDWLDMIEEKYPQLTVKRYEIFADQKNQDLFQELMADVGGTGRWVPVFLWRDDIWEGFNNNMAREIEVRILDGLFYGDNLDTHLGDGASLPAERDAQAGRATLELGILGSFNSDSLSLAGITMLVALVDGFNPCSLWVLTILLAMVINSRSRLHTALVGGLFLLLTALVYGLFITGLFTNMAAVRHARTVQVVISLPALVFAIFSIKDSLGLRRGFSLTISGAGRKTLVEKARRLARSDDLYTTLALTAIFAVGAAIVELPCTAGFPVIWTVLISDRGLGGSSFLLMLALYLGVYMLAEIIIVVTALVTMKIVRVQENHGRVLKLLSGSLIAALALVLLAYPSLLHGPGGLLIVMGLAMGIFLPIYLRCRFVFRYGTPRR